MRIVVAGSSGFVGRALTPVLRDGGHEVVRLVRGRTTGPDQVAWNPDLGQLDHYVLDGVDAVINLAGVNIGERPLTRERKREVLTSRLRTTGLLARQIAAQDTPPVLLQASAYGAYGERGDDELTESEPFGDGFLADVVQQWEAAAAPAQEAGARVVFLRSGMVFAPSGGALHRILPLVRAGLSGPLGSGNQYWSWISLPDEVRAIEFLLTSSVTGPVNLVSEPARSQELLKALADQFDRPSVLRVPAAPLRFLMGDFASEVLGSARAVPAVLRAAGFRFSHPDVYAMARWVRTSVLTH